MWIIIYRMICTFSLVAKCFVRQWISVSTEQRPAEFRTPDLHVCTYAHTYVHTYMCICMLACLCTCEHMGVCTSAYALGRDNWSGNTLMVGEVQVRLPTPSSISHAHSSCKASVLSQEDWLNCTDLDDQCGVQVTSWFDWLVVTIITTTICFALVVCVYVCECSIW